VTVRRRIILLSILVAYVPVAVLAVSIFFYVVIHRTAELAEEEGPEGILSILDKEFPEWRREADWGLLSILLEEVEAAVVVDRERGVIIRGKLEAGEPGLDGLSVGQISERLRRLPSVSRLLIFDARPGTTVVAGLGQEWAEETSEQITLFAYVLLAVTVFAALLGLLFIRSVDRSIVSLRERTEAMAEGDLDSIVVSEGNDSFGKLAATIDRLRRRLHEDRTWNARFVMGAGHDLKTPLAVIRGYVDAVADGLASSPDRLAEYLEVLRSNTSVLKERIQALIDYASLETQDWRRTLKPVALRGFLEELAERFADESRVFGYRFEADIHLPPQTSVSMNPGMVERALENLVQNALRYGEGASVRLYAALEEDGSVEVGVHNLGKPMSPEDRESVFEPFYRGDRGRNSPGSGLGLPTVRLIVESHGWSVSADSRRVSESVAETEFVLRIPIASGGRT
jgi:signal transduction histidine kinase